MPEYLAPGVYVEETSFRQKVIEGVSTSTAGFVGPARFGPTAGPPELLTSFADFERIFGGLEQLTFVDAVGAAQPAVHNFLAQGVRAFFEEGGRRCYVTRIYEPQGTASGRATANNGEAADAATRVDLEARFPGRAGNMRVTVIPRLSDDVLVQDPLSGAVQLRGVREHDTVVLYEPLDPTSTFALFDVARQGDDLILRNAGGTRLLQDTGDDTGLDPDAQYVFILTVDMSVERPTQRPGRPGVQFDAAELLQGFSLHPQSLNALTRYFADAPPTRRLHLSVPFLLDPADAIDTGYELAQNLLGQPVLNAWRQRMDNRYQDEAVAVADESLQRVYRLGGGSDGQLPSANSYRGDSLAVEKTGLAVLEDIEDISMVAAPGYSHGYNVAANQSRVLTIQAHLINHAERMRYRIAVLDAPDDAAVSEVREFRGKIDSKYAALYYPWVRILDPATGEEINLPPSGFVTGIYARNDVDHGVQKAPANEVVRLAIGFESMLNKAQQEVLNPEGINCFRFFEGRGHRLWGARTATSDGEWKYVNLRRYFAYLEHSIDKGTQIFVFESNGERLWENVRRTVEDFLFSEWKAARLMGLKPEEAYFVRCDRTTMTQNDIDNGRLICLIGVAPLRPAEFVIFRIGQKLLETRG